VTAPARIWHVDYTSVHRRRKEVFVKVPYGGLFAMTELLTRMLHEDQIVRFQIRKARAGEITPTVRASLERWLPALVGTSSWTGVDWTA